MEEKILEILKDNKEWNSSLEYTAKELLNLFSVSHQRELLIAFAKYMEEDKMYERHDEANADDFLENYSN